MRTSVFNAAQLLSLFGTLAAASPIQAAAAAVVQGANITWTGKIFEERDEYTLHGDVVSIYHQIRDINPSYAPATQDIQTRALMKRSKNGGGCGSFASAYSQDAVSMMNYLAGLGGTCSVGAGPSACTRLACINTSGLYLCNDGSEDIAPGCNYLATYVHDILNSCGSFNEAISGQEFDTDMYNVVVAYANCNDPSNVLPSGYSPPGVNGSPYSCTNCVDPVCAFNADGSQSCI